MADREALLREAERNLKAQLRERTSEDPDGTPSLDAWLRPVPQTLDQAVASLVPVLSALKGQNDYVQSWRVVRSAQEHDCREPAIIPTCARNSSSDPRVISG